MRSLVVCLPAFRLERCGYEAEELAGLIGEVKNAVRLVAVTPEAGREGLRIGMTASEARALVPAVRLIEWVPEEEEQDRSALVRTFQRLSDRVRFPWPDALALSIDKVSGLFGGEEPLAHQALQLAHELGHQSRVAIADDPLLALAVATWATEDRAVSIVPPGEGARAIAPLPIESLLLPEEAINALRVVGVRRVGEFARLDPASVAGRYPKVVGQHRVARGLPGSLAHLVSLPDLDAPRVSISLPNATTTRELTFVLPDLVQRLCGTLAERDRAVVRVRVSLGLEAHSGLSGRPIHVEIVRVGRPTRSPVSLERLIRRRLEQVKVDSTIESLSLEAVETAPDNGWQPGLADRREATEPLPDLIARLSDQLGERSVLGVRIADCWRPEAAWESTRFPVLRVVSSEGSTAARLLSSDPVEVQEAYEHAHRAPRPAVLLPDPVRVEVVVQHGVPVRAHLGGRETRVEVYEGPERLTGDWWSPTHAFDRAYWMVKVGGRRAWIFQDSRGWHLHGWFD